MLDKYLEHDKSRSRSRVGSNLGGHFKAKSFISNVS
jgi:hypothetical protein